MYSTVYKLGMYVPRVREAVDHIFFFFLGGGVLTCDPSGKSGLEYSTMGCYV